MKLESLVIVNHQVTVNMLSNLVHTARHAMGISLIWKYKGLYVYCKIYFNIFSIKLLFYIFKNLYLLLNQGLGWSRNKVAVGEPVAGLIIIIIFPFV